MKVNFKKNALGKKTAKSNSFLNWFCTRTSFYVLQMYPGISVFIFWEDCMSGRKEIWHCVCLSGSLLTFCCGIYYLEVLPSHAITITW